MKGVAAHLFDKTPPPPELVRALNYKAWGVVDIMALPGGLLNKMNAALSYYYAITGYQKAASQNKSVDWSKKNPEDWELVSWIIQMRKKGDL